MPITIDGAGTITGISAGGLPDSSITSAELATGSVLTAKIADANVTPAKLEAPYTLMTSQTFSAGQTVFDFTGIPSWAKRITILMDGLSLSGSDNFLVQLGDAGGFETTGYVSQAGYGSTKLTSTTGFIMGAGSAAFVLSGTNTLYKFSASTNQWLSSSSIVPSTGDPASVGSGTKTLSDTLTQLRVTRTGSNTFDAGSINVIYEG